MYIRPPDPTRTVSVFLSSGDDAGPIRDRAGRVVDAINGQLDRRSNIRLQVRRWEDVVAQRPPPGRTVLEMFVEMARDSHITLVLLLAEVRAGTLEEIQAVLAEPPGQCQLAVLCFCDHPREVAPEDDLHDFLRAHQDRFLYQEVGGPDSDDAWLALFALLLDLVFTVAFDKEMSPVYERR